MKLFQPLRERDYGLLWTGMTVSLLGDGIYLVAVAWQVYDLRNDPTALALVGMSWTLGMVAFLITGGILGDRVDRRRLMIGADVLRAAVLVLIGVLSLTGMLEIWHLIVLVAVFGAGESLFGPAFGALVPDVVHPERLVQANSLDQVSRQLCGRLLGPALGGVIVALAGAGTAFLIDAGTFLASAACIAAMRVRSRGLPAGDRSARRELLEGIAFVRSQPWLWATILSVAIGLLFFLGPLEVLLPYLVRNELGGGAGGYGAILACAGVGSIVASVLLGQRGVPRRYLTFQYSVWSLGTMMLAAFALGNAVWQLMLLSVVFGGCITAGTIVWGTLMQSRVPPELRGRVHSIDWLVSIGLTPVSFALTGPLSSAIGVEATLILAGVVPALATGVLYVLAGLSGDEARTPLTAARPSSAVSASATGGSTPAIS